MEIASKSTFNVKKIQLILKFIKNTIYINDKYFDFSFRIFYQNTSFSDEIIRDENGNYILIKKDGTFKKLPPPKPGNKYVIKKDYSKEE